MDLATGVATVEGESTLDAERVTAAVRDAGYGAEPAPDSGSGVDPEAHAARLSIGDPSFDVDLIVIGGGSAGFAAAIAGHEAGARVLMVNDGVLGGTCVNVGCVPSKPLIRVAEADHRAG